MSKLNVFVPITKVDAQKGIIYGVLAAEELDRSGEIFDYEGSKPYFQKWSDGISKATDGKSVGNLRAMHGNIAAGKFTSLKFNDEKKQIEVAAKVIDKNELEKAIEGVYTGFSIGGRVISRVKKSEGSRYVCDPYEGSLVDLPCIESATFECIKADGAIVTKNFNPTGEVEALARDMAKLAKVDPDAPAENKVSKLWQNYEMAAIDALAAEQVEKAAAPADVKPPTNDEIAARAREIAKAAGNEGAWLDKIEDATKALTAERAAAAAPKPADPAPAAAAAADPAADPAAPGAAKAAGPGATPSDDGTEEQVWVHKRLPGKTYKAKAEMRAALVDLDAAEAAEKAAEPVKKALAGITATLDTKDGGLVQRSIFEAAKSFIAKQDEAFREMVGIPADDWKLAGEFAKANPQHEAVKALAACHITVDAEKNVRAISDNLKGAIEKVVAAAKAPKEEPAPAAVAKAAPAELPEIKDAAALKTVVEGTAKPGRALKRHVLRAATALDAVGTLPEAYRPVAVLPVDVKKIATAEIKKVATLYGLGRLIELLGCVEGCEEDLERPGYGYGTIVPKEITTEFGSVLVRLGDIVARVLDLILAEMKAEEAAEAADGIARGTLALDIAKALGAAPLVAAGAAAAPAFTAEQAADIVKRLGLTLPESEAASEVEKRLTAAQGAFNKTLTEIADVMKDVAERVKNIEAQPLPEGTTSYRVVEKGAPIIGDDVGRREQNDAARNNAEIFGDFVQMAVRAAHRQPQIGTPGYHPRIPG